MYAYIYKVSQKKGSKIKILLLHLSQTIIGGKVTLQVFYHILTYRKINIIKPSPEINDKFRSPAQNSHFCYMVAMATTVVIFQQIAMTNKTKSLSTIY